MSDMSIKTKLFLSYLLLIAVPFLLYMIINSYIVSKDIEDQTIFSAKQMMAQTATYLEAKIDLVNSTMHMLSYNDAVQNLSRKSLKEYQDNLAIWDYDMGQVTKQFFYLQPAKDILKIRLYMVGSFVEISETENFLDLRKVQDTAWYKKLVANSYSLQWFSQNYFIEEEKENYISAIKKIKDSDNLKNLVGVIRVDLRESIFNEMLSKMKYTKSSSVFLINSSGEIISTTSTNEVDPALTAYVLQQKQISDLESIWESVQINTDTALIGLQKIRGTDWKLVQAIPYTEIKSLIKKSRTQVLILLLLVILMALPISFSIASSGTKRFRKLIANMKKAEKGDFNVSILPSNNDEIGQLTKNFNHMMTKIAMLLDEQYAMGQEIKNTELKALQAQINPHFLYNALDQISWMAREYNAPKICSMVKELSNFYKLSLGRGESIVTVENELEHVKAYIYIQNIRFSNAITLVIEAPDNIMQLKIPKLTLQPVVENSILHGILEGKTGKGTIKIFGKRDKDTVSLIVSDDGVGMSAEKLQSLLDLPLASNYQGYGMKNINEKLKLLYGNEYGLTFESTEGLGTTVIICFSST